MSADKELLGYWTCEAGGRAEVRQTVKRGRHFYTRCECCGLNQGAGAVRQQAIYDNAEFIPGVTVVRPSNVAEKSGSLGGEDALEAEKSSEPVTEQAGDFDPTQSELVSEPPPAVGLNKAKIIGGFLLLAAAGVGAWMN